MYEYPVCCFWRRFLPVYTTLVFPWHEWVDFKKPLVLDENFSYYMVKMSTEVAAKWTLFIFMGRGEDGTVFTFKSGGRLSKNHRENEVHIYFWFTPLTHQRVVDFILKFATLTFSTLSCNDDFLAIGRRMSSVVVWRRRSRRPLACSVRIGSDFFWHSQLFVLSLSWLNQSIIIAVNQPLKWWWWVGWRKGWKVKNRV